MSNVTIVDIDSLTIIGGGNMGAAFAQGLLAAGQPAMSLSIVEVSGDRRRTLGDMFPGVTITETIGKCSAVVIAVKPPDVPAAVRAAVAAGAQSVLSIAAGVSVATLQHAAGPNVAVVRAMPNTPSLVGQGASAYALGANCNEDTAEFAALILGSVGVAVQVDESQLDAITGLTGSGPAYLFFVAEALIAAGTAEGLDPTVAEKLVRQLFLGTGALLAQSPETPSRLREMVTSPGGTTAAGLAVLGERGTKEAFSAAVAAATARSAELGRGAKSGA
jgi:pyrroline-5-carboxylate reductase